MEPRWRHREESFNRIAYGKSIYVGESVGTRVVIRLTVILWRIDIRMIGTVPGIARIMVFIFVERTSVWELYLWGTRSCHRLPNATEHWIFLLIRQTNQQPWCCGHGSLMARTFYLGYIFDVFNDPLTSRMSCNVLSVFSPSALRSSRSRSEEAQRADSGPGACQQDVFLGPWSVFLGPLMSVFLGLWSVFLGPWWVFFSGPWVIFFGLWVAALFHRHPSTFHLIPNNLASTCHPHAASTVVFILVEKGSKH